ncbi:MAG TPA: alpha/beta hydrolase [Afifellaceae bacterium]|nr:alpha/beta hydrolase [Afifellaceae bacterium]
MSATDRLTLSGDEGIPLVANHAGPRDGPPVLLLHGGGQTRHAWEKTARRLAEDGYRAIYPDQRGHGDSAWHEEGHYAFIDYAADLALLLRAIVEEGGRRPVVVGASLGGFAAILSEGDLAPGLMRALVLVDITPRVNLDGVARIHAFMRERASEGFVSLGDAADAVARYLPHRQRPPTAEGLRKNLRQRANGRFYWHWDPRFIDGPRPAGHERDKMTVRISAAAARLSCPVLLVRGARSELIEDEHVREFQELVPHGTVIDVRDAGHMVAGDRNDVFGDAVIAYLGKLEDGDSVARR